VPEIASRAHVEALPTIIAQALAEADSAWEEIGAVAVTRGPGLASSLMPGVVAAQALAYRLAKPLWTLNHLEAHIYSVLLDKPAADLAELCPMLVLTVSGGHSNLIIMRALHDYQMLGSTIDDAAGEALDKAAKLLGLGYPGGPAIETAAQSGDPDAVKFPRGDLSGKSAAFEGALDPRY
jgi:N6-L-threonylcarbamoyladenine synthase